jgi:L-lactate dehydrogenase complex protein LldF
VKSYGAGADFRSRSVGAVGTDMALAVQRGTDRFASQRRQAAIEYQPMDEMRQHARSIRAHTVRHLGHYLALFADRLEEAGGAIHFAADAAEATQLVADLVRGHGGTIIKSKSMVTEELELNRRLQADGRVVIETDLGEFIAQLAGEPPSHIVAPVLHKTRQEIGRLFADRLSVEYTEEPSELNHIARSHLRPTFLTAGIGITGANFAVAATGSVVIVTNEGNGWLSASVPPIHIAVMGLERLVPGLPELGVLLEVLARSATGQRLSAYTTMITGPRRPGESDGPHELHVVVVDNGRSRLPGGTYEEVLTCIRCGACLNVCPVYRQVGGHAYGSIYPGPIGAVLSPVLFGLERFGDLAYASTLCGACLEVCPIQIDLPRMLLELRRQATGQLPRSVTGGVRLYTAAARRSWRWRGLWSVVSWSAPLLSRRGWIEHLPGPGKRWTASRDLRRPTPTAKPGTRRRG